MKITKKKLLIGAIVLWIIFSIAYIAKDTWDDFKLNQMNVAYRQGKADTITSLIKQAQQCNAIPVDDGTNSVNVVNVDCLQQSPSGE